MDVDLPRDDVVAVIDQLVDELLDAAKIANPPVDCIDLAQRHLGMVICLDKRQVQRGRAQRTAGKQQIYLRPEDRLERHQWTVAHEIGEHIKVELLQRLGLDPSETRGMTGESLANLFSYRLLVPTRWFAADARDLDYDLLALKKRYATASHEVIAFRFLDLPDPCIVTVIDNEHIHRRRSNAWPTKKQLAPVEQKCQRLVHETGRPKLLRARGWTVQGWPVHTPEWKREILRSVVEES
jgi:Zn-dependent peptidase ImmA (M78 family)